MERYRKLIAAVVGFALIWANRKFGVDLGVPEPEIVDGVITLLTLLSIERLPNAPAAPTVGGGGMSPGGVPMMLLCGLLMLPMLGGCQTMTGGELHSKPSAESAPVTAARRAIDEANAALTAVDRVIAQNAVDQVWTKAQAQGYLNKSKDFGKQADEARDLLRAGDPFKAENQAKLLRQAILVLHKEVAAQARSKP